MSCEFTITKANVADNFIVDLVHCARRVDAEVIIPEKVISRAGNELPNYINMKNLFGYPETRDIIANAMWSAMDRRTTHIACMGYGGDMGVIVADRHGLDLVRVKEKKDKEKSHGPKTRIIGPRPGPKDFVTIIDDTLTTGSSIEETRAGLIEELPKVNIIEALVGVKRGRDEEITAGLNIRYLFTLESFQ